MASTAFSAASLIPLAAITDTSELDNISFASLAFLPFKRTITGTFKPNSSTAWTTPRATRSQRTIPPKMLINIDFTFLSAKIIRNPFYTVSALAVPPTSKKFAGSPPAILIMSIVAIAKPAPFTIHPTFPSNFI